MRRRFAQLILTATLLVSAVPAFGQSTRLSSRGITSLAASSQRLRRSSRLYFTEHRDVRETHYDGPRRWLKLQGPFLSVFRRTLSAREADERLERGAPVFITPIATRSETVWFGKDAFRELKYDEPYGRFLRGPRLIDRRLDRPVRLTSTAATEAWFADYGRSKLLADGFWTKILR